MLAAADRTPTSEGCCGLIQELSRESESGPESIHPRGQHQRVQDAWRPRDTSEVQADERAIPDITDLDVPLVMGNRLREPIIKAIQEAAKVSWDRKRKGSVEDEDAPLSSEELRRLESLSFSTGTRCASPRTKMQARQ